MTSQSLATSLLLQQINVDVLIVTSKELATDDWLETSTRHCKDWTVRYLQEGQLTDPIEVLARIDELCVVADEESSGQGFDLKISPSIEDLFWRALNYHVPAKFFCINGWRLGHPEESLKARKVPQRVAEQDTLRENYTQQLKELHIDCNFGSSGLWDSQGGMIRYDLISLPFQLVRRLSAWQRNYDENFNPPASNEKTWWDKHEQEMNEIAKLLQDALGSNTRVKVLALNLALDAYATKK